MELSMTRFQSFLILTDMATKESTAPQPFKEPFKLSSRQVMRVGASITILNAICTRTHLYFSPIVHNMLPTNLTLLPLSPLHTELGVLRTP